MHSGRSNFCARLPDHALGCANLNTAIAHPATLLDELDSDVVIAHFGAIDAHNDVATADASERIPGAS